MARYADAAISQLCYSEEPLNRRRAVACRLNDRAGKELEMPPRCKLGAARLREAKCH